MNRMYNQFEIYFNLLYYVLLIPLAILIWRTVRKKDK